MIESVLSITVGTRVLLEENGKQGAAMKLVLLSITLGISVPLQESAASAETPVCPAPKLITQQDVQRYIVASEDAWAKSVATNDASVVRRILADDFIWVLDGKVVDKKTAVNWAAAGPGEFLSNEPEYVHVRFFGDTAVAQGSETWTKKGGKRGKFVWTDTWVKRADCWQIVNAQDTVVPLTTK